MYLARQVICNITSIFCKKFTRSINLQALYLEDKYLNTVDGRKKCHALNTVKQLYETH